MIVITEVPERVTGSRATSGSAQRDIATTEWMGQQFRAVSGNGACMALARQLVEAGCPDQEWMTQTAAGKPSLKGPSLHRLAQLTITGGLVRRNYAPIPAFRPLWAGAGRRRAGRPHQPYRDGRRGL